MNKKTYNKIMVIDGITNGITAIERKKSESGVEYFNVYTSGGLTYNCGYEKPHVSLKKEDMITLVDNVKNKQLTLIGITNSYDEIIDEINTI